MTLQDFYCDSLELRFRFASGELNARAFFEAVTERGIKPYSEEDGNTDIAFSFGSRETSINYHAHLRVRLKKDESGRAELNYHLGPLGDKEEQPPYVEECAKWLGGFFQNEKLSAHIHANYTYGKSFAPVITLPFPLMTSEKVLTGALVTGLSLLLPNEGASKSVIIQSAGDETYIFLRMDAEIELKGFDLSTELKTLSAVVNPLVRKQKVSNETSGTTKTE